MRTKEEQATEKTEKQPEVKNKMEKTEKQPEAEIRMEKAKKQPEEEQKADMQQEYGGILEKAGQPVIRAGKSGIFTNLREGNRSYVLMELSEADELQEEEWEQFLSVSAGGLLTCRKRYRDGKCFAAYDVTGRQAVCGIYEEKDISYEELLKLLLSLDRVLQNMHEYLLSEDGIMLKPETVFWKVDREEAEFIYGINGRRRFQEEICFFAEYILEHIDHRDERAVVLSYRFYKYASSENFCMEEFLMENREQLCYRGPVQELRGDGQIQTEHAASSPALGEEPESGKAENSGCIGKKTGHEEYYELRIGSEREREYEEDYEAAGGEVSREHKEKAFSVKSFLLLLPLLPAVAIRYVSNQRRVVILGGCVLYAAAVIVYQWNRHRQDEYRKKDKQLYLENRRRMDTDEYCYIHEKSGL